MAVFGGIVAGKLAVALLLSGAVDGTETRQIEVEAGDRLVVRNNAGTVDIQSWERPVVEVRYRIQPPASASDAVEVLFRRSGNIIRLQSYFYANRGESVDFEVKAPADLNVAIYGIEPQVRVEGLGGNVRVMTLRGDVEARQLTSRTVLFSHSGNLSYRTAGQPDEPVILSSRTGNVECELTRAVDLAVSLTGGESLKWNGLRLSHPLRASLGSGWPTLQVESAQGQVDFRYPRPLPADADLIMQSVPRRVSDVFHDEERPVPLLRQPSDEPAAPDFPHPGSDFQVNVDWVHLNVSVRDKVNNTSITDLRQEDFEVYENGRLQQIERFESTQAPYHMLLLLDISNSTEPYLKLLKKASIGFASQLDPEDRIAVAVFNTAPFLLQDFTSSRRLIKKAIKKVRSYGGTGFYYSLDYALRRHMNAVEGRKAVVVFTDGIDDTLQGNFTQVSDVTFPEVYRTLQESDSLVYIIFLDTEEDYRKKFTSPDSPFLSEQVFHEARIQLEMLTEQAGGRFYSPLRVRDLVPVYAEIAHELRQQYTLGFVSNTPRSDASWRRLRVRFKNPDLAARHRQGYYLASPDPDR